MTEDKKIWRHDGKHGAPPQGNRPLQPGREPGLCSKIPGNPRCAIASPGFICEFDDGTCLRYKRQKKEDSNE